MSRARQLGSRLSGEAGSAIVEMIVVVPLLMLVLMGIVELSRAWFMLQAATAAAREGARAGATAPLGSEVSRGQAQIDSVISQAGMTSARTSRSVVKQTLSGTTDFEIVATVNMRFQTVFPVILPALQTINMTETATMRYECNPAITPCSPPP